jgi:hypothetical protein
MFFPFKVSNIHIFSPTHVVPLAFDHFASQLAYGLFNLTSVQLGPLSTCFLDLPSQLVYVAMLMALGFQTSILAPIIYPHPICKMF